VGRRDDALVPYADPEKARAYAREYQKQRTEYMREWRARPGSKEKFREYNRRSRLKHLEKNRTKERQYRGLPEPTRPRPEVCENCGRPPDGRYHALHLDHCHITGKFRGWLCYRCNVGIGLLGDSVEGLDRARKYLTSKHGQA